MALGPGDGLTAALGREKESFAWGSLVIVVTPTVEEALPKALLDLRSSGYDVNVVLVGRGVSGASAHAALAAMGVSATRVRSEEDIRGLGV